MSFDQIFSDPVYRRTLRPPLSHVRFALESGHQTPRSACPLGAIGGLMQCIKEIGTDALVGHEAAWRRAG
jgi:hypothetical protein